MEETMDEKREFLTSQPLTSDEAKAKTKISQDFFSVFSNQVRVAAAFTEFRIFFGENFPTATGEVLVIENLSVVLSPPMAKHLAEILTAVIQKVEALSGPIPVLQSPPSVAPAEPIPDVDREL